MHLRSFLLFLGLFSLVGGIAIYFASPTSEAQRAVTVQYDYAVIQGSYKPYPPGDAGATAGAVNICYISTGGCHNEEIKAEVIYSKFAQDERLEGARDIAGRAQNRAMQIAFSKAIVKLGGAGFEMVDKPQIEFDLYYESGQAAKSVIDAPQTARQHIWFKRVRQ
jgi:hypothetical protein